jgi:hypothetical protein
MAPIDLSIRSIAINSSTLDINYSTPARSHEFDRLLSQIGDQSRRESTMAGDFRSGGPHRDRRPDRKTCKVPEPCGELHDPQPVARSVTVVQRAAAAYRLIRSVSGAVLPVVVEEAYDEDRRPQLCVPFAPNRIGKNGPRLARVGESRETRGRLRTA